MNGTGETDNPMRAKRLKEGPFIRRFNGVKFANRVLDRLLGIDPGEVLNSGALAQGPQNPDQELMRIANQMRAEALDPATGRIDYRSLAQRQSLARFRTLTRSLSQFFPNKLESRESQMAFWIDLYNALILEAIIAYQLRGSLRTRMGIFRRAAYKIAGMRFSADDIENGISRANRRNPFLPFPPFGPDDPRRLFEIHPPDPRVHFALVCGAASCPPIAFYEGQKLEEQLEMATAGFIHGAGSRFAHKSGTLWLSKILDWYKGDFGGREGLLALVRRHLRDPRAIEALDAGRIKIRYLPYDWTIAVAS